MPPRRTKIQKVEVEPEILIQELEKKRDAQRVKVEARKASTRRSGLATLERNLVKIESELLAARAALNNNTVKECSPLTSVSGVWFSNETNVFSTSTDENEGEGTAMVDVPRDGEAMDVDEASGTQDNVEKGDTAAKVLGIHNDSGGSGSEVLNHSIVDGSIYNGQQVSHESEKVEPGPATPSHIDVDHTTTEAHTAQDGTEVDSHKADVGPTKIASLEDGSVEVKVGPLTPADISMEGEVPNLNEQGLTNTSNSSEHLRPAFGYSTQDGVERGETGTESSITLDEAQRPANEMPVDTGMAKITTGEDTVTVEVSNLVEPVPANTNNTVDYVRTTFNAFMKQVDAGFGTRAGLDQPVSRGMLLDWRHKPLEPSFGMERPALPWNDAKDNSTVETHKGGGSGDTTCAHRVGESNFGAMGQVNRDNLFGGVGESNFGAMGQVNRDSLFGGLLKIEDGSYGSTLMGSTGHTYNQIDVVPKTATEPEAKTAPKRKQKKEKEETETRREREKDLENARDPAMREAARQALVEWRFKQTTVPKEYRRLMRNVDNFVPECASICYSLSLHILMTEAGNVRCLQHSHQRTTKENDEDGSTRDWTVTGTPYRSCRPNVKRPENLEHILNCGCHRENAVLEFYLFKTGKISSVVKGQMVTEGWRSHYMHPRMRELILLQVRAESTWCLDDIWRFARDNEGRWSRRITDVQRLQGLRDRISRQIEFLQTPELADYQTRKELFETAQPWKIYDEEHNQAGPSHSN
ncbi:hypothetical protein BDP27DRAFT_1429169 [Rhodocollybia butyracea]|uniref:Uncharacterized protein n=1 Tax=Rhodocollybia butyracea TaxID=206335 RepID=A0A9P5PEM6_9AGAR|nr:hypothetical protein BDP27DRAFT_1429169 [Rhodocollybia butyracea]